MVTPLKFTHEVRFESLELDVRRAYLTLIVRASQGAVSLRVALDRTGPTSQDASSSGRHGGWTLNGHFKRKTNDWWLESEDCDILEQGHCFGDTGYMASRAAWDAFLVSEEQGWKYLEDTYNEWRKPS